MSTKIEWAEESYNPITGCDPDDGWQSEACAQCYARRMAQRLRGRFGYPSTRPFGVTFHEDRLDRPLHWQKPRLVFVCSMGDLFHADVDDLYIRDVFGVMAVARWHTFNVLTKRPLRALHLLASEWFIESVEWDMEGICSDRHWCPPDLEWPLPNVRFGVTVENQRRAIVRREYLREIPAVCKFVSYEPALGPVDWAGWEFINWMVYGGQTGPKAQPSHPGWFRSTREWCLANEIPQFFKSWGEWEHSSQCVGSHTPNHRRHRWDDDTYSVRVGKQRAGRLLDGREWNEYPKVSQ